MHVILHIFLSYLQRTNSPLYERADYASNSGRRCRTPTLNTHKFDAHTTCLSSRSNIIPRRKHCTLHPIEHFFGFGCIGVSASSTGHEPKARKYCSEQWSDSACREGASRRHPLKIHLGSQRCQTSQQQTWYLSTQGKRHSSATVETLARETRCEYVVIRSRRL